MALYIIVVACAVAWLTLLINKKMAFLASDLSNMFEEIKKLLFDIRNGTSTYYDEKRKTDRIPRNVTIKVTYKNSGEFVKTLDLSEGGALIRVAREFRIDEIIDMNVYLPLYAEPISAKGKVLRVSPSEEDKTYFETGVEFINLSLTDKEKLIETLSIIRKKQAL